MKSERVNQIFRMSSAFIIIFQIGISFSMSTAVVQENSPGESGIFQEYFSSYNNLDYVHDLEWDIWDGMLRIPIADGFDQEQPQVAGDKNGNTYIVWQDERSGDYDIYAQKLDGDGNPLWESDVRVSSGLYPQKNPAAVVDLDGDLVVVWEAYSIIYAQKLDEYGNRLWVDDVYVAGDEYTFWYDHPDVAVDSEDHIVVVYAGWGNFGANIGIWAQKLDESGNHLWPDYYCVGGAFDGNWVPAVAVDSDDNVIVAWVDSRNEDDYEFDIYAAKINSNHTALWGNGIRVNSDISYARQMDPKITVDSGGNIYIVWGDERNIDSDIYGQKLDPNGNKLWAVDKRVNLYSGSVDQEHPVITGDGSGNFVVAWEDNRNSNADIYAQKIDSNGNVIGANDVRVHVYTGTADQRLPAITLDSNGYLVLAWEDYRHGDSDIYAQKLNISGSREWEYDARVPITLDLASNPNHLDVLPESGYLSYGAAQSNTVDTVAGHILSAILTAIYQTNGGQVRFFLSNNGGNSWTQVLPGASIIFSTPGSDLRWKVELEADPLRLHTPQIDSLRIDYLSQVSNRYLLNLPIIIR